MPYGLTAPLSQLPIQDESFALFLVFMLAVFFVVNYFAGRMYNVSKGRKIASMVKDAISDLDSSPRLHWTTKAIVFSGTPKNKPVSEYRLNLFMMGRENILNWAISRLVGRADMAIFMANLPKSPKTQFDMIRKNTPPHRALMRGKRPILYTDAGETMVQELAGARSTIDSMVRLISNHRSVWTFSVRRETPELVVNMALQGISPGEFREMLQSILLVCERVNAP